MSFRELVSSKGDLVGIGIDITQKCNRSCPTCYVHCDFKNMHFELFRKIIDEGVILGFNELYLLGGEPTLHPEILEFLEYAKNKFQLVILVTNMDRLSDKEFCQSIYDAGVVISGQRHTIADDHKAREMDAILSGGYHLDTSHQAWKNVESIFSPERVCVQCCITKPVVESGSIFEVFRWARHNGYDPVMEFTKDGNSFARGCQLDVSPLFLKETLEKFREIDQMEFGLSGATFLSPQAYGKTCHLIENSMHFLVDGTAIPCVGHQNISYGNIESMSLKELTLSPLRNIMRNSKEWVHGFCRDECAYFDACTAGCRGYAFGSTGCARASFYNCPNMPWERFSLADMIPSSCFGCALENYNVCNPKR